MRSRSLSDSTPVEMMDPVRLAVDSPRMSSADSPARMGFFMYCCNTEEGIEVNYGFRGDGCLLSSVELGSDGNREGCMFCFSDL